MARRVIFGIALTGFAVCLTFNIATYFISYSKDWFPRLAFPTMIIGMLNAPVGFRIHNWGRGMSWDDMTMFKFAPGWARLLYLSTFLYAMAIGVYGSGRYPHHYESSRYKTVIDAPLEVGNRFWSAALMILWAGTLAVQYSALKEKLPRRGSQSNSDEWDGSG